MNKKIISLSFIIIMIFSFMALPVYAATQTYSSELAFKGEHAGATREYKYRNISYSAAMSCYLGNTRI